MQNEAPKRWFIQALAGGAVKAIAFQVALLALPFVVAGMTIVAGAMQSVPWMWVLMAGSVAFAGVAMGMLRFADLLARTRVEGKLHCASPRVAVEMTSNALCLGVNLVSTADVPVEFEIEDLKTELSGSYPPKKPYLMTRFTVPPAGFAWFDDYPIQDVAMAGVATGLVDARIRYGKLGRMKYELRVKKQVHLKFDPSGAVIVAFNDAA